MSDRDMAAELRELAARLTRIEKHLHLAPPVEPEREAPVAPPPPRAERPTPRVSPGDTVDSRVMESLVEPLATAAAVPPSPGREAMHDLLASFAAAKQAGAPSTTPAPAPAMAPPGPRQRKAGPSWEVIIGERWMAWVGAIVVVVAVGFFVKLAYDLGWWGRLSPLAKCLISAGFGFALIAAGEIALRRVGRVAAIGLYGAGLGALYLTAYATFRYFHLLSESGAFWLMLVVALLGIGLTIRGRMISIGILSLIGGYLTPILLSEQVTFAAALPLYLSTLFVIALVLSATMPQPFRTLRYVAAALHVVVASTWIWHEGQEHWLLAVIFLTAWWALVSTEAMLAAAREQSARGNPIIALLFTFWYVSIGCGVLASAQPGARDWLGIFTGAVAAVSGWAALAFGPGLTVLRGKPRRAVELMTTALWAQTGVLLATAIGLQFRGQGESFGQSLGWIIMGLACVELGRRLPSRGVDVFGLIVGLLGIAHFWVVDTVSATLWGVLWTGGTISIDRWTVLALVAAGATLATSRRLNVAGNAGVARFCGFLTFTGTVQWAVICFHATSGFALTAAWAIAVAALILTARLGGSHGYRKTALFLLLATTAKWLLLDAAAPRLSGAWTAAASLPLLNLTMGGAVLIAACYGLAYADGLLRRRVRSLGQDGTVLDERRPAPSVGQWLLVLGSLFILVALSFQVEHLIAHGELARTFATLWRGSQVRMLWLTLLWAAGGWALIWAGRRWVVPGVTNEGSLLLAACCAAWPVYSLAWRIDREIVLTPVVWNLQGLIGLALAVLLGAAYFMRGRKPQEVVAAPAAVPAEAALLGSASLTLITLSFEADRLLGHWEHAGLAVIAAWPPAQTRLVGWTLLWVVGGLVLALTGRRSKLALLQQSGWATVTLAAAAWLTADTLYWRATQGVLACPVVLNAQFGVGLIVVATVVCGLALAQRGSDDEWPGRQRRQSVLAYGVALILLAGLWLGSLELDRYFAPEAARVSNPAMARQTALSIYWGVYAIGLVALGFWKHSAAVRYAGLALLAITLGKVLIVDLAHVQYVYRVLSLLAVGLLFIVTSIAYARLASQLRERPGTSEASDVK